MSQIYLPSSSTPPPSVATTYNEDSGSATPALNILNVLGNDTSDNNVNGIQTLGSGNTVTIQLTNRLQGTGQTGGIGSVDIITFTPSVVGTYSIEYRTAAYNITSLLGAGYSMFGAIRYDGSDSNICDTFDEIVNEEGLMASVNIEVVTAGASVILRATGYAAQTINWSSVGIYTFIGV